MKAILVDVTRCTGCEKCVAACLDSKDIDPAQAANDRVASRDGLSARRLMAVEPIGSERFARKACMHCNDASCVSACLVGGLTKSPEGPVVYDSQKCIGCRYCMLACPFHVPRYEWEKNTPLVRKCDMCIDRLGQNLEPACVAACPNGALMSGERWSLIAEANLRIAKKPDVYIDHVWGETEFGGTSVIYVSDIDLEELGWGKTQSNSIPSLTNPLIEKTPFIGGGVAASLLAVNWVIKRRMKLAKEQTKSNTNSPPNSTGEEI